jgi:glutathione synthase/RimK-type ligase-like ATP-grasp enzyme
MVPFEIGEVERGVVDAMSAKLVADGMFFVGIDLIGDKVVEINAESPSGLQSIDAPGEHVTDSGQPEHALTARDPGGVGDPLEPGV